MRRVLIDECINPRLTPRLRANLPDFIVETVRELGWQGLPDHLLRERAQSGFDVFVTIDKGFEFEHNLEELSFSIIILETSNNQMPSYERLLGELIAQIRRAAAGTAVVVSDPQR